MFENETLLSRFRCNVAKLREESLQTCVFVTCYLNLLVGKLQQSRVIKFKMTIFGLLRLFLSRAKRFSRLGVKIEQPRAYGET